MPDFGIFRGFNDKLFGNKLYAGQLPTQLGLIGSVSFGFDTDALAFFNRVTTAGGTLSTTEKNAVNQLVIDLKGYSIWSKMKAIYPMVGASADACKQNLVSSSFTGSFSSGWTFASTGVTPNGTNAYMNTNLTPSVSLSQNSASLGCYIGNNLGQQTDKGAIGAYTSSSSQFDIYPAYTGLGAYVGVNDSNSSPVTNSNTSGFFIGSRTSSSQKIISIRNTQTTQSSTSNTITNIVVSVGAINISGVFRDFSAYQHRFVFIGDGLTTTEITNLNTAVQAFQTTLARQV